MSNNTVPAPTAFRCAVPGCTVETAATEASVPSFDAMKAASHLRRITLDVLDEHVHCRRCTSRMRHRGVRMYPYLATRTLVEEWEHRAAEEAAHFRRYMLAEIAAASGNGHNGHGRRQERPDSRGREARRQKSTYWPASIEKMTS